MGRDPASQRDSTLPGRWTPWLDALGVGLIFCDAQGRIVWHNVAAKGLLRWRRIPQSVLRTSSSLLPGDAPEFDRLRARCWPLGPAGPGCAGYVLLVQREVLRGVDVVSRLRSLGASPRQIQVFLARREGLREVDVADKLGISAKTVDHHIEHLYRRVGVHGALELEAKLRHG